MHTSTNVENVSCIPHDGQQSALVLLAFATLLLLSMGCGHAISGHAMFQHGSFIKHGEKSAKRLRHS